jgi:uncharacterized membrane protein YcaP (DUF421 family)
MLDLTVPWWELVVRGVAVYVVLLIMVRATGKRALGQFTPFDLLVMLLLSEAVSNSLNAGDESLFGGLLIAGVLILLDHVVSMLSARSERFKILVEGRPTLLGANGRFDEAALRRENVAFADVQKRLREENCELEDVEKAYLETDGNISIVCRKKGGMDKPA